MHPEEIDRLAKSYCPYCHFTLEECTCREIEETMTPEQEQAIRERNSDPRGHYVKGMRYVMEYIVDNDIVLPNDVYEVLRRSGAIAFLGNMGILDSDQQFEEMYDQWYKIDNALIRMMGYEPITNHAWFDRVNDMFKQLSNRDELDKEAISLRLIAAADKMTTYQGEIPIDKIIYETLSEVLVKDMGY